MTLRILRALVAASVLVAAAPTSPARADNAMGYKLLSAQEAAALPRNRGSLGMDIVRAQAISSGGMTFDVIRVTQVRRGSPGAKAGFRPGDNIIAVDGCVFPTLATFAAYIGSLPPGTQATVDYIPANGGPGQAQRVTVITGAAGQPAQPAATPPDTGKTSTGLSTGSKVAIGAGAAALFGCYELGCFSRRGSTQKPAQTTQPVQPSGQYQQ